jgi:Flp pilus assembly protein TadG
MTGDLPMRPTAMIRLRRGSLYRLLRDWIADGRGVAATEFAFIVPLMLVMFFGTVEFCSAIAVNRKVTLIARTLSDLTSQSTSVADADISTFFTVANKIIWPYTTGTLNPYFTSPMSGTITELFVDPTTHQAKVKWSKGTAPRTAGSIVTTVGFAATPIPTALLVDNNYLILSEVSYNYVPTVGYVMAKAGVTLNDVAFTRPRQSTCVFYSPSTSC